MAVNKLAQEIRNMVFRADPEFPIDDIDVEWTLTPNEKNVVIAKDLYVYSSPDNPLELRTQTAVNYMPYVAMNSDIMQNVRLQILTSLYSDSFFVSASMYIKGDIYLKQIGTFQGEFNPETGERIEK